MKELNSLSKALFIGLVLSVFLTACGSAPRSQNTVIDEQSAIVVSGKHLIGLTVELSNGFRHTIVKSDINRDVTRMPSIKRKADENVQSVVFNVDTGEIQAKIFNGAALVASKTFFISNGATYQWKIK